MLTKMHRIVFSKYILVTGLTGVSSFFCIMMIKFQKPSFTSKLSQTEVDIKSGHMVTGIDSVPSNTPSFFSKHLLRQLFHGDSGFGMAAD